VTRLVAYIDTGAWIALLDRKDAFHASARATRERLRTAKESLVTGWHTLVELADGLARHADQARAASTLSAILASPTVRVEPSQPHVERAMELFSSRTDWNVDLSDCLSFALMEAHEIRRAFAYDRDFEKAGFEVIG
jgi:predicted nucleic acid-binding protein